MATETIMKKLKEVMEFPAAMTFKVAGVNREGLAQDIVAVIQKYLPGDYIPKENPAAKEPIILFQLISWHKTLSK